MGIKYYKLVRLMRQIIICVIFKLLPILVSHGKVFADTYSTICSSNTIIHGSFKKGIVLHEQNNIL